MSSSTAMEPIQLHHGQVTVLSVDAVNTSSEPVTIAHVRLEGQLLDLIFLTYDTGIHETLQPGEQRRITFPLDFFDLEGQAHGLLRSQITLFDPDRQALGHQDLIIDGRGSPLATMAIFNLVLAGLTGASVGWNLLRLSQRRLPVNRFARGLRFIHSGAGVGLTVAAACSTLRIWPLTSEVWIPLVLIAALVGFAAGYLSPGSETDLDDILIDLIDDESVLVVDHDLEIKLGTGSGPILEPDPAESSA
ncbi:MAG: hypothetical protein GY724_00540 [Actinomycetia bacterium]|nr:hypothetical protein [Actinomycetes bacterium]MCP4224763.1 hypothetical protein [Actinomycetes bacterium]MCP5032654.1 hypothetical protein [Actinomycetes bacterium]